MPDEFKVPRFASEAEEAQWWYDHHDQLTNAFEAAELVRERMPGAIPTTTIRLDPDNISHARVLASKRGLHYQTYLKMLLHEALVEDEKKLAS